MKKILIVTTKFPFPLFRGDNLRIYNISNHLSKTNKVDLIYTGTKENFKKKIKFINKIIFIKANKIKRLFYIIYFFMMGKPLRVGYFFSSEMKEKIEAIHNNYDCIIFHSIEGSAFLPNTFKGKKILEMTDLLSKNYLQLFNRLNFFNPKKYLYLLEQFILKRYEKNAVNWFDHVILVSSEDAKYFSSKIILKNKIKIIPIGVKKKKKIYKFNTKNKDIIFIGNINYMPNKIACYEFIEKIMPKLKAYGLNVNFKIIGQTSKLLKFDLNKFHNVKIYNNIKFPEKLCNNAICGIANLSVATGMQFKILEYMSMGLPAIISKKCYGSLNLRKNHDLLVYKNHDEFAQQIIKLNKNKNFSNKLSKNCYKKISKDYTWTKSLKKYNSLI